MNQDDIKAAEEMLRKELMKAVTDAYGRVPASPPSPAELQQANEAIDEIIETLDFGNLSQVDFDDVCRELGIPRSSVDPLRIRFRGPDGKPGIDVDDRL